MLVFIIKRPNAVMVMLAVAVLAPLIAPQNPYDTAQLDLWKSELPPLWQTGGEWPFLLGTDTQGRDMLSVLLYGTRISVLIGFASVVFSLVIGLSFGMAILTEATLSFLGIGMPPGQPSLGTLIRIGNQYLFSGLWWMVIFPVMQLSLLVVAVNLLGDWLRDALNPKLR